MVGMRQDPPAHIQNCCSLVMEKAPYVPNMAMPQMLSPSQAKSVASDNPQAVRDRKEEQPRQLWAEAALLGERSCP